MTKIPKTERTYKKRLQEAHNSGYMRSQGQVTESLERPPTSFFGTISPTKSLVRSQT